jgi:hypothetical protein
MQILLYCLALFILLHNAIVLAWMTQQRAQPYRWAEVLVEAAMSAAALFSLLYQEWGILFFCYGLYRLAAALEVGLSHRRERWLLALINVAASALYLLAWRSQRYWIALIAYPIHWLSTYWFSRRHAAALFDARQGQV